MNTRRCTDRSGIVWDVFEVYPGSEGRALERVPVEFRAGWLCFQSETERRRLAPIPRDWAEWDERALLSASERGQRTQRRTPPELRIRLVHDTERGLRRDSGPRHREREP